MSGTPGSLKALPALAIALLVGIVLAWSQRSTGPSRAELAEALSKTGTGRVAASDIRSLRCAEAARGFTCRWQQLRDDAWIDRTGNARIDGGGWHATPGS
ncbi:MAG: hypothetical protein J7485_06475 [Sphingobium sp.]|nr:hypothetical protein [Sphingobium sp.]